MANIKKSFNFRNGVQVDNDNFIVNANGLVGIGSTIPTQLLDVAGNVRIRGILYADSISGEIIKTSEDAIGNFDRVNIGITSISSGIITSTSGIITYYGDGSNLQGLPTSQWIDVDPALNAYISIYSAGNVGIATTNPIYTLQIGGNYDLNSFGTGVGISSTGIITASSSITAHKFVGIGSEITLINPKNISSGTLGDISINTTTGIITAKELIGIGSQITQINPANISSGTLGDISINTTTGIVTASKFVGSLVGIASTARGLTTDANIDIVSIVSDYSNLGIATVSTLDVTNSIDVTTSIGVGTEIPNSDIQLRKDTDARIEVTSDTNAARIVIGRKNYDSSLNINSFGVIRFGNNGVNQHEESTEDSLDIINYAPGNVNYYIRPGLTESLKFNWINHSTNGILASLTAEGKFGIGITNPSKTFEVVGTSTITSHSFVGGDFKVYGSITGNSLTITGSSTLDSATFNNKVGIFANSPNYSLQIGSSLNATGTSGTGVGIGSTTGNITASGTVNAFKFSGIGSEITLINPKNISSGTLGDISINTTTGIITAKEFIGIGSKITQINAGSITGTLGDININTTIGIITAKELVGIGSQITQISANNISGTLGDISINTTTGIITAKELVGIGSQITQISANNISGTLGDNINIYSPTGIITANRFEGNIETNSFDLNGVYKLNAGFGTFDASPGVAHTLAYYNTPPSPNFYNLEYSLLISNNDTNYQSQIISIVGNSNAAISTEYGVVYTSSKIGFCTSGFIENKVSLNFTPESGVTGLTSFRYVRKILKYSDLT